MFSLPPTQVRERGWLTVLQAEDGRAGRSETLQQRGMRHVISSGESLVVDRDGYHGTRKSQVVDGFGKLEPRRPDRHEKRTGRRRGAAPSSRLDAGSCRR